jgi:hypothetical protein
MNDEICTTYLSKIIKNMENNKTKQAEYLLTLKEALKDPMISRLMRTPLQATIIAILVKSGGDLPRDRYNLFTEYYSTIVKRERQKKVIETISDDLQWINDIHCELAFVLQSESEGDSNPSALLSKDALIKIIKKYISDNDQKSISLNEIDQKSKKLYEIIVYRLNFVTELQDEKVGFYIRSVQEFFAANFIVNNRNDEEVLSVLKTISYSSYWRNVLLFSLGFINKTRNYLEGNIDSHCSVMNGDDFPPDCQVGEKISLLGSWLSLDILLEGIFKSNYKKNY